MSAELIQPVLIAVLVVIEVAVWQLWVALATRGRKRIAALLGAVNAVLSVVVLGQVVSHLDRPWNIVGYAVGVAVGVYLGVAFDDRVTADPIEYRIVVPGDGVAPAAELRSRGWPVTLQPAVGLGGLAAVLFIALNAGRAAEIARDLDEVAPGAFRTSSRLRSAAWTPLPDGYIAMGAGSRIPS